VCVCVCVCLTCRAVQVKNQFLMDKTRLLEISSSLIGQMQSGLCKDSDSSLKMLPSHLTASATGAEVGEFLALDLGGTNFRVLKVCNQTTGAAR
jgi:hexokinase